MKIKITALLSAVFLLLCGCTAENTEYNYDSSSSVNEVSDSVIAQNGKYMLEWNSERKYISLKSRNGTVWSSIPEEFLNSGVKRNKNLEAPVNVTLFNPNDKSVTEINGFSYAVSSGRVGSEKIKNGIKVTYYFDKYRLSVPISYVLNGDALDISVIPEEIEENDFKIVKLSLAPYFCSAKNGAENSYLFVPSGSGALMNCYEASETARVYSGNLYGIDKSRILIDAWFSEESVKLPVFGAKSGNSALFGIVKSYSGTVINASAGDPATGFSTVYPSFELRGYDETEALKVNKYIKYSDEISVKEKITVSYYLLEGENAGYETMAPLYRKWLAEKYGMIKSNADNGILLTFYGGDLKNEFIFGIPYKKLTTLTDYSDVENITEEIIANTGVALDIKLSGFTENGLSKGKLGGDFKLSSAFGSSKAKKSLFKYAGDKKINIYPDFDIVNFNKSGGGFTTLFSAAKTANRQRMSVGAVTDGVHTKSTIIPDYYLLSRKNLNKAAEKLNKALKSEKISAVALSALSNTAYSDYAESDYYTKGNIGAQVSGIFKALSKNGVKILAENANDYAAACAEAVSGIATYNGGYSVFDCEVPFYQMVFSGYKKLYSPPLNEQTDYNKAFLDAIATGTGISFSVIKNYDTDIASLDSAYVSKALYRGNRDYILKAVNRYKDYLKLLGNACLVSYTETNGITKSIFDNGVTVYTNITDKDAAADGITVKAGDFTVKGADEQ